MYSFWAAIKTARSAAYFKKALDSGGTGDLQEKWKNDPSWKNRIILSGIILGATSAIFARTLYRKAKSKMNKSRRKRNSNNQNYDPQKVKMNSEKSLKEKQEFDKNHPTVPEEQEHFVNVTKRPINEVNVDKKEIERSPFDFDDPVTGSITDLRNRLRIMKPEQLNINDTQNYVEIRTSRGIIRVNGSGIFNKNHMAYYTIGRKETLCISKMLRAFSSNEYSDILSIFEAIDNQ